MNSKSVTSVPAFPADGLSITAAEPWFKVKVELLHNYLQAFITHAVSRADQIVVVDLFAGSGLYSVGHQKEIFPGFCFRSVDPALPISKWIFCESDPEAAHALKMRVSRYYRNSDIVIVDRPVQRMVDQIKVHLPVQKSGHRVAALCVVNAFSLDVPFTVIQSLASQGFNFLFSFTFPLNDRVNFSYYLEEQRDRLEKFLGVGEVERFRSTGSNQQFYKRLVQAYQRNMLMQGLNTAVSIHVANSKLMQIPGYYIGLFSRKLSASAIQKEVTAGEHLQYGLF